MKDKLPRKYRIISRVYRSDADNCRKMSRRVCRLDAPENFASPRYVGMYNDDAGDIKTAETLVLSGFAGGGGAEL